MDTVLPGAPLPFLSPLREQPLGTCQPAGRVAHREHKAAPGIPAVDLPEQKRGGVVREGVVTIEKAEVADLVTENIFGPGIYVRGEKVDRLKTEHGECSMQRGGPCPVKADAEDSLTSALPAMFEESLEAHWEV